MTCTCLCYECDKCMLPANLNLVRNFMLISVSIIRRLFFIQYLTQNCLYNKMLLKMNLQNFHFHDDKIDDFSYSSHLLIILLISLDIIQKVNIDHLKGRAMTNCLGTWNQGKKVVWSLGVLFALSIWKLELEKLEPEWIMDSNVKHKTTNLLEESVGKNLAQD